MSVVTDMVLYISNGEIEAVQELELWCYRNDSERHQRFEDLRPDGYAGGSKYFTSYILAMAGNHFPYEELIKVFWTFPWKKPEKVVLIINHENEDMVRVLTYEDKAE